MDFKAYRQLSISPRSNVSSTVSGNGRPGNLNRDNLPFEGILSTTAKITHISVLTPPSGAAAGEDSNLEVIVTAMTAGGTVHVSLFHPFNS